MKQVWIIILHGFSQPYYWSVSRYGWVLGNRMSHWADEASARKDVPKREYSMRDITITQVSMEELYGAAFAYRENDDPRLLEAANTLLEEVI